MWSRSDISLDRITSKVVSAGEQTPSTKDDQPKPSVIMGANANQHNKMVSPGDLPPPHQSHQPPKKVASSDQPPSVTSGKGGNKCRKCNAFFTSEKLLEKHFLANHEFKCKFCELVLDKDVYGDHLRRHLATERKKTSAKTK